MKVYLSSTGKKNIKGKILSILFEVPIKLIDLHNLKNYAEEDDYNHFIKDNLVASSPEKIENLKNYNLGISKVFVCVMFNRRLVDIKHSSVKIPTYSSIIRNNFYLYLYPKQTHASCYEGYIKIKEIGKEKEKRILLKLLKHIITTRIRSNYESIPANEFNYVGGYRIINRIYITWKLGLLKC